jgi:hypothetical protein
LTKSFGWKGEMKISMKKREERRKGSCVEWVRWMVKWSGMKRIVHQLFLFHGR